MKKKVLLCSYGGGHINMLVPIYRELIKSPKVECHFFALTTAINTLSRFNIPFESYRDYMTSEDLDAQQWGQELLEQMGDSKVIPTEESIAYLGLSFKDLVSKTSESEARQIYSEKGRHAFLQESIVQRVLDKHKPDLVITTNAPKSEEAMVLQSAKNNIPCMVIWDLFQEIDFQRLSRDSYGHTLCVLSPAVKERLINKGRSEQEICITGNPAFDPLLSQISSIQETSQNFKKQIGADGKKVILWAQQNWSDMRTFSDQVVQTLIKKADESGEHHIIVRPHPNDDHFKDFDHPHLYISREPSDFIPTLLGACDSALSINSTLILESSLAGLNSFTIEWTDKSQNMSFAKMNITEALNSFDDFDKIFAAKGPKEKSPSSKSSSIELASPKVAARCFEILNL